MEVMAVVETVEVDVEAMAGDPVEVVQVLDVEVMAGDPVEVVQVLDVEVMAGDPVLAVYILVESVGINCSRMVTIHSETLI